MIERTIVLVTGPNKGIGLEVVRQLARRGCRFTATDPNQHRGTQTVAQGAAIVVQLAMPRPDGTTGGFCGNDGPEPW
jgi:NAD(P)-dependent dehydrogenase (short-subunit alcohol dehydrogenase family)